MPELPDVETVARRLRRALVGRKIRRVRVLSPSTVRSHSPDAFVRQFRERQVTDVQRRGKYLLISLDNDHVLVAHLRMTGDFEVHSADAPVHPHTRVAFVANGRQIRFVDQRRFGHIDLVRRPDLGQFPGLSALGIEPLSREFTVDRMEALFAHRRGGIKAALLRQDLIAGVGNIYADEILWQARLHPARRIDTLSSRQIRRLFEETRRVLAPATRYLSRYGRPVGALLDVRTAGGHCPRCGRPLAIETIAGRTTYFCRRCQR